MHVAFDVMLGKKIVRHEAVIFSFVSIENKADVLLAILTN